MDPELSQHSPITPEIIATIQNSATMLVILSPGYLASEWCLRERNIFLSAVRNQKRSGSRTFIVEMDRLEDNQRPPEFGDLLGYRFWVADGHGGPPHTLGTPKPDDRYYKKANKLCYDLANELTKLYELKKPSDQHVTLSPGQDTRAAGCGNESVQLSPVKDFKSSVVSAEPAQDARPTVFLAEVTDDLDSERDDVKAYLDQAGIRVLPETWYPRDPIPFEQALDRDLAQCKCFIQLLSELPGKRAPGTLHTYVRMQYDHAKLLGLPITQWRSPELDVASVKDTAHRIFLNLETVMAVGMREFKPEVVQQSHAKPSQSPARFENTLVFVNAESTDSSLAKLVHEVAKREGVGSVFPLLNGAPAEVRKDLEKNLLDSDAILILYGKSPVTWVRDQLRYWHKICGKREQPIKAFEVWDGPPEPKDEVRMDLPNVRLINCRSGLTEADIRRFLQVAKGDTSP
jgi:hypothetical protein